MKIAYDNYEQDILDKDKEYSTDLVTPIPIDDLDLSVRSNNCLRRAGINTVDELTQKTEDDMMKVRNLGRKSLEEVKKKLADLGLGLRNSEED